MNRICALTLSSIAAVLIASFASAETPKTAQNAVANTPVKKESRRPHASALLVALDADGNGNISAKEIRNSSAALLTLDKNGDGSLDHDELRRTTGKKHTRVKRHAGRPKQPAAKRPPHRVTIDIDVNVPVFVARGRSSVDVRPAHGDEDD